MFYIPKVRFWKQITTSYRKDLFTSGCVLYTKGTILKANHNFLKTFINPYELCFIYQRYDFESKSQQFRRLNLFDLSCVLYTKGTILKANHNICIIIYLKNRVVFYIPKVRFWKQITTYPISGYVKNTLCFIYQRYDFESKSQHEYNNVIAGLGCVLYTKGTILKANHNYHLQINSSCIVVFYIPKVRFWKQITTILVIIWIVCGCVLYTKGTILKANHNVWQE